LTAYGDVVRRVASGLLPADGSSPRPVVCPIASAQELSFLMCKLNIVDIKC